MRPSRARTQWARKLYPDPRPLESIEEFSRAIHADLSDLSAAELHRELALARLRAASDDAPSSWLGERLSELEAALAKLSARQVGQ